MTQREVAELADVEPSSYARMEGGRQNLTLDTLALIAGVFGVPAIALLEPATGPVAPRVRGRPRKTDRAMG